MDWFSSKSFLPFWALVHLLVVLGYGCAPQTNTISLASQQNLTVSDREVFDIVCVTVLARDDAFRGNGPDISPGLTNLFANVLRSELSRKSMSGDVISVVPGFSAPPRCLEDSSTNFSLEYSPAKGGRISKKSTLSAPAVGIGEELDTLLLPAGWQSQESDAGHLVNPIQANLARDVSASAKTLFRKLTKQ